MLRLFHISEEKNINEFIPRESKKQWSKERYVWAISEEKIHNYLLPRECPRICISMDKLEFLTEWINLEKTKDKKSIIFISNNWKERVDDCILYRYEFNASNFVEIDKIAGYYVSKSTEIPIRRVEIKNCLKELSSLEIELVITDNQSLEKIKEIVVQNLTKFSIIKWDNL